jgi:putative transposase
VVSFKKEPSVIEPDGVIAFDINERSLDGVIYKNGIFSPLKWDLSSIYRLHNVYFKKRKNIQSKLANSKYKKILLEKYSSIEKKRVELEIHKIGKQVSKYALENNLKIVFEDLKNIRNSVNKKVKKINKYNNKEQNFSVHSKRLKRRLNSWNFRKLQQNIDYKVSWLGLQVQYVNPKNTSKACAICGQLNEIGSNKQFVCVECGFQIDRQLNACLNLIKTQDGARWFSADNFADDFMYLKSEGVNFRWVDNTHQTLS